MNNVQRQLHEAHKARRERLGAAPKPNLVLLPSVKQQIEQRRALEEAAELAARQQARMDEQRRLAREAEIERRLVDQIDQLPPELFLTEAPVVRIPSLAEIRREVCEYFKITQAEMMGSRRNASTVLARHFAYYIARSLTGASLTQIGRAYKRDHSSVIHAIGKMEELVLVNSSIAEQYKYFENKLAYRPAPHAYWGA